MEAAGASQHPPMQRTAPHSGPPQGCFPAPVVSSTVVEKPCPLAWMLCIAVAYLFCCYREQLCVVSCVFLFTLVFLVVTFGGIPPVFFQ